MTMLTPKRIIRILLSFLVVFVKTNTGFCQNYVFAQLNGSPINTTGWNLQGDARVTNITGTNNSELLICSVTGASGAVFYNQPINLSLCSKWIAEFDFRMYDGTGADGIAFCFLDVPPIGLVTGGGLGIPNSANGLKVCFDTWNNCIPFNSATVHLDMPKIELRWGIGYNDDSDPSNFIVGECRPGPTKDNADGSISFIRSPNYNHAKITYDSGKIQVFVNDILYLTGYQQFNFQGYLGFTASTGGYNDNHSIKNVVIYTQMPPSFAGNTQRFCPHDTIQIGGPSNPSYAYSWYPSTGLSDTSLSAPYLHNPGDSVNDHLYKYFVRTSFKDKPGCASTDSVSIEVFANPIVQFITPQICLTDAVAQFYDSTYTHDSTTLPFTYLWNFGDPNAQLGNSNSSVTANPSHRYSAASNYFLSLQVTNIKGCVASKTKIFTVNGAVPKADFKVNADPVLCSNQKVEIINQSSVDFGSITRVQIFWGDSAAVSYIDSMPFPGKQYFHNYPNPVTANISNYTIHMISYSGIRCGNESDQQITVQPSPHVEFKSLPAMCNYDSPVVINQALELTEIPGSFIFSGKGISESGLFDPRRAGIGENTLKYTYTSIAGCADSAFQTVSVSAPPLLNITKDTSVVVNQPLQLEVRSSDSFPDSYIWSPATGLNDPTISNPIVLLPSTIDSVRYLVRVTDTVGCFSETSIFVKLFKTKPDIFVPNAFTPGKATNNVFRPIPIGISSIQYFRVYDRWGQLLFNSSQMGQGWDGSISGKPQGIGSYVWVVQGTTYAGERVYKKGTVTLIR